MLKTKTWKKTSKHNKFFVESPKLDRIIDLITKKH